MFRLPTSAALGAALLVSACAQTPALEQPKALGDKPVTMTPPAAVQPAKPIARITNDIVFEANADALNAFRRACPRLLVRKDASGLTTHEDWKPPCADQDADPQRFFTRHFTTVSLDQGNGLATGYYEPELQGSLSPIDGGAPILAKPPELVDIRLKDWDIEGGTLRGIVKDGKVVRAPDREAIEKGAFAKRGLELGWAKDPVDLFFLQIQGSGSLALPDGRSIRIGYASQNGHPYTAIGKLLRERGILEKAGMAEIRAWLAANPAEGVKLMRENKSYVFFRRLPDTIDGPIGALNVPLIPMANVAADPATLPLGAPVWLETMVEGQAVKRLFIASDTGGAIKGANRFDIFFGPGEEAARKAGALAAPLKASILLPKAAAARL